MALSTALSPLRSFPLFNFANQWIDYWVDAGQRMVLTTDALRQRGNDFIEHAWDGKPPLLDFDYEMVLDGADLNRPVNYALLRIVPAPDYPVDPFKRPIVIVDPRAGHGPGVGGFKPDSQVGVAMRAGHPVYFVTFAPYPVEGQTLTDIGRAEARFLQEVHDLHPGDDRRPVVVGNCQAGWAVASLAAVRPDLMGPIFLNGAPLAYWSGEEGKSPMRYLGGLLGGKWLATFALDLGNGLFDGANLVGNFEALNPARSYWGKLYNLYAQVDEEAERYLTFERWWGGFFFYGEKEYSSVVGELFIGNKLARGEALSDDGIPIDLRNIRSPIVVFASWGDNITPPQQALNWIVDVYGHENHIVANEQVIVYLLHEDIGHLGIFVSGEIARKEHSELFNTIEIIDHLPPGLYEMVIDTKRPNMPHVDLEPGDFTVRFERRRVADLPQNSKRLIDDRSFSAVRWISELSDNVYQATLQPWIRLLPRRVPAAIMRAMHPLRLERLLVSDLNPMLWTLPLLAEQIRQKRRPLSEDNWFWRLQDDVSGQVERHLDDYRHLRDHGCERAFQLAYGTSGLGALMPEPERRPPPDARLSEEEQAAMESQFESGGLPEALVRMLLAITSTEQCIERRTSILTGQLWAEDACLKQVDVEQRRQIVKDQTRVLYFDRQRALQGLRQMLPDAEQRRAAYGMLLHLMMIDYGDKPAWRSDAVAEIRTLLEIQDNA